MIVDNLDKFYQAGQNVAILGAGLSGQAARRLLNQNGWECKIFDEKQIQFSEDDAAECSFVVTSPGFRPDHPWLQIANSLKKIIFSEVDLGAFYSQHEYLLAITGTNGKTSLTTILAHLCREIGVACESVGNIGRPFCDLVAEGKTKGKYLFLETSSFQSINIQKLSPDGVIWTNFSEDHLDYHDDKKSYFTAKLNLVKSCKNPHNVWLGESVLKTAKTLGLKSDLSWNCVSPLSTYSIPRITPSFLKSYPQRENLALAKAWFEKKDFPAGLFFQKLIGYKGEPYRLSKIDTIKGIKFWNDSKSTNLASVISACKSFKNKLLWIGGGKSKGQKIEKFGHALQSYVSKCFVYGECSSALHDTLKAKGLCSVLCSDLKDALKRAYFFAKPTQNILFSPGFASFDSFTNYAERGNYFDQLVFDLKRTEQRSTNLCIN